MGNCILLISSGERERERGKKEDQRRGRDCSLGTLWGAWTLSNRTRHWWREKSRLADAANHSGSAFFYLEREEREKAEFMPKWMEGDPGFRGTGSRESGLWH